MAERWRTILAIDHDAKACETYRANVPADQVVCGEVRDLLATLPPADVILGGPPCQPYSTAGKRKGADDHRDCVPDFCAAIESVRPRMFLMEEVAAFATDAKFLPVLGRTLDRFSAAGYDVQYRILDAVDFGVAQFRKRVWFWGVRRDLPDVIAWRRWPMATHADPVTIGGPSMFGEPDMLPWVTCGQALGLDGAIRRPSAASVERRDHPACEPSPTRTNGGAGSGGILRMVQQSHANPPRSIAEPASTLRSGGAGHDGCCVRIIGGRSNPRFSGDIRTERDITAEPSTTIAAAHMHNALPAVREYRWSDAMRRKHPPASPASPAPTVQAKWHKGGAEGLLSAMDRPSPAISGGGAETGGAEPVRHGPLRVRRLTPDECARLQSMPDYFVWPESVKKTHRYRIVGNGWASLMAKRLSEAFSAADPDSRTVIDLFCGGGCGAVGWHGRAWEYTPTPTHPTAADHAEHAPLFVAREAR